ncbi:MAG: TonB-dependent receptor [Vicinamibacterales bacterium]
MTAFLIRSHARLVVTVALTILLAPAAARAAAAQAASVAGTVKTAAGRPVANAAVVLEGPQATKATVTDPDGRFSIPAVPPGTYHLVITADGYLTTRTELTVGTSAPPVDVTLAADPHFSEVVSVSPDPRSAFDSYQPTVVLGGQDLAKQLQSTLGLTLENQPGMASRSFGPGPSRPVIRGLDGDRVLVLEDGNRMGDLSSQSGDHGVNVNPASAEKIEVVRGPATLLYGSNAIGGLVNVITDDIPTKPVATPTGTITLDSSSAAPGGGGAGSVTAGRGPLAVHFSASGRRSGDYASPDGDVPNSFSRGGFVQAGASYVGSRGYVGASFGYDRTHYGIPFVEEGETSLDPRRKRFDVRAERRGLPGPFESVRATAAVRRYAHDELDGNEVATSFLNDTNEFELKLNHKQVGRLHGTVGVWGLTRSFSAEGEEALSPPVSQKAGAAYLYEEAAFSPHVTFQFGGRVDHTSFDPEGGLTPRTFTNFSGSLGLLVHPTDATTVAFSLARASRNPALEELYFLGPHAGNNAFEQGNDQLDSEHGLGFDASFRWQQARVQGEITYFINRVDDFVYRGYTDEVEDDLPVTFFAQGQATLQGIESHVDVNVAAPLWIEGGLDYVHGQLTDLDVPLPRMPPLRGRLGVTYKRDAFQAGVDTTITAKQNRIFLVETDTGPVGETATDGYTLVKCFAAWSFVAGRTTNTIAARLDNAGNTVYRNHLNYLKDLAPEAGRDFRVTFTIGY